jgi:glyoxylase-like metal-dependent hydrolase (beta-lactamase superfamily II)
MDSRNTERSVHRLEFGVEWRPGHVASYLLDGPEPVLVDAATPDNEEAFRTQLETYGYGPADIDHVLLTHPHVDHIGLVSTVLEAGDPTVYAPVGVRERLSESADALGSRIRANCVEAGFFGEQLERVVGMAVGSLERNAELLPPAAVDVWIEPGDRIAVGQLHIDAIHAPGHQADHLCYPAEIDGESALLAGDMGIEPFRPILLHDGFDDGYREAFGAFYTALERLAALDVDRVYPGHGPVHDDLAGAVRRDRESLDDRLERVEDLVANGYSTAPDVVGALAGDRAVEYLIPEAMSALAHLETSGTITSELTDGVRYYRS